ncbi:MAG: hypothetical protein HY922_07585 [Elusimicrobia bacterium]|nr:hypothetical protein [Elusimicrobiota bacterium]
MFGTSVTMRCGIAPSSRLEIDSNPGLPVGQIISLRALRTNDPGPVPCEGRPRGSRRSAPGQGDPRGLFAVRPKVRLDKPFPAWYTQKKLEKGRPIPEWEGLLFNRLEAAALSGHPEALRAKRILRKLGLRGVLMSGSGSSVFGFVSSEAEGKAALKRLQVYPWKAYHTCLLG